MTARTTAYISGVAAGLMMLSMTGCASSSPLPEEEENESVYFRQGSEDSSPIAGKVYEWMPAPGQFINEELRDGTSYTFATAEEAARWAEGRLAERMYVSLGGFGGYIVVGFDHSVVSSHGGYDFAVGGNAFLTASGAGSSNEPGIVYVMQDRNGNQIPDDIWYELKGSDYGSNGYHRGYEVTYFRPEGSGEDVGWTDNQGRSGKIAYLPAFHSQASYYPAWVAAESYTLRGSCVSLQLSQDGSGLWKNQPLGWGYADNVGSDTLTIDGYPQCSGFRISDAIDSIGNPANLDFIDFVKIQTGVNASSGWLGEISTEVTGVIELNEKNR